MIATETKNTRQYIHVLAPAELREAIKRVAAREYCDASTFVRMALAKALREHGENLEAVR